MAADRLRLIRDAQPTGPYRLCGYCNGGVVAFEVARGLISAGGQVEMVGMIDPPPLNAPIGRLQRLSNRLWRFSKLPVAQQWAAIRRKVENLSADDAERTPFERSAAKLSNYFPKPLGVRVLYFSAGYEAETWRRVIPDLEVIGLSGDHLSVLIDPTDLAENLRARLQPSK
jgi:thioesterase domain-containing protein